MERDGHTVKALAEKPVIDAWSWIWQAWSEMSGDRIGGMGPGATPWISVDAYARRYGIEDEDFELFAYGIRVLDTTAIDYHNRQYKEQIDSKQRKQAQVLKKGAGK